MVGRVLLDSGLGDLGLKGSRGFRLMKFRVKPGSPVGLSRHFSLGDWGKLTGMAGFRGMSALDLLNRMYLHASGDLVSLLSLSAPEPKYCE